MNASWRLKEQHAEIFEGFITYGTEDAINWFVMPIATPQGTTDHEVRFITSPLESAQFDGVFWTYTAQIEIKKRQVITEEEMANNLLSPLSIEDFVAGIRAALDTYQG
tara:strand:- start:163 stop:486 length:324 start_codon:yes stop_codon:yes gene_type:complete